MKLEFKFTLTLNNALKPANSKYSDIDNKDKAIRANPNYPVDYDNLITALATPTGWGTGSTISATFPYGQTTKTINGKIESFSDTYKGYHKGYKRWDSLDLTLTSNAPVFT